MQLRTPVAAALVAAVALAAACATASAAPRSASSLPLAFTIDSVTVKGKELPIRVYASGAVTAVGTWRETTRHGLDHVTLAFPAGKLFLTARETLSWKPDLAACIGKGRGGTTWKITGGTGAYRGAGGGGRYSDGGTLLGARDAHGSCLGRKAMPPFVLVTADFVGRLTLP